MNHILEINEEDMYVTVGVRMHFWKEPYEALSAKGLRTPYFGPLSGKYATIGGALSQNSLFMGSGVHHTVAESALGLRVVLANGDVLQTGSGAHRHSNPFYRHFGPDVTGMFTADTGAYGNQQGSCHAEACSGAEVHRLHVIPLRDAGRMS